MRHIILNVRETKNNARIPKGCSNYATRYWNYARYGNTASCLAYSNTQKGTILTVIGKSL